MKIEVDQNTSVQFSGKHGNIKWQVSAFNFKQEQDYRDFKVMWCTYILLSEEQYAAFKDKLDSAPWNGGITYNRKITEESLDAPPDSKWRVSSWHKIGDDFSHSWDLSKCWDENCRTYMESHVKRVIDYLEVKIDD